MLATFFLLLASWPLLVVVGGMRLNYTVLECVRSLLRDSVWWGRSIEVELHYPVAPFSLLLTLFGSECGCFETLCIQLGQLVRKTEEECGKTQRRENREFLMLHQPPLPATTSQLDFRRHASVTAYLVFDLTLSIQTSIVQLLVRLFRYVLAAAVRYHDLTF